jgi:hypothetical protein
MVPQQNREIHYISRLSAPSWELPPSLLADGEAGKPPIQRPAADPPRTERTMARLKPDETPGAPSPAFCSPPMLGAMESFEATEAGEVNAETRRMRSAGVPMSAGSGAPPYPLTGWLARRLAMMAACSAQAVCSWRSSKAAKVAGVAHE